MLFSFENADIDVNIYPNPSKGQFTVRLNSSTSEDVQVKLFDLNGRVVFNKKYKSDTNFEQRIHINDISSGMYFIEVKEGVKKTTKKIIIE